jgi:hypothetical protein
MLNPEDIDALRFESLLKTAERVQVSDPHRQANVLTSALDLWRGPALLDLCDNELGRNEAVRLWELRLSAEEQRFSALLECGMHRTLVAELIACVDAEPFREERWALLMLALYRSERRAEALRTYQRLREFLATELGIEPSTKLSALELSILQSRPELEWRSLDDTELAKIHRHAIEEVAPRVSVPLPKRLSVRPAVGLVGRSHELEIVDEALKRVANEGEIGLVLVHGEAGAGKTALLAEAARAAVDSGAYVLFGRCEEDLAAPYQLFGESLNHYFDYADEQQFSAYVAEHGFELSRVAPVLKKKAPGMAQPRPTSTEDSRALLFSEVTGLLATISKPQPVVLVFDDLQWADPASLHLLRHLVSVDESMRVLVLGAYRDSGLLLGGPLLETLESLWRQGGTIRLEITGLDFDSVVSYMEGIAGHSLDESLLRVARVIYSETDGNPFFLSEVLRHLVEIGRIQRDDTGRLTAIDIPMDTPLPKSVSEVIGARVMRL